MFLSYPGAGCPDVKSGSSNLPNRPVQSSILQGYEKDSIFAHSLANPATVILTLEIFTPMLFPRHGVGRGPQSFTSYILSQASEPIIHH